MTLRPPLYFKTEGPKDAPCIILLHGFLGSHKDWEPYTKHLKRNYFIIRPDLPGHGKSLIKNIGITFDTVADQLREIFIKLGITNAFWVGYSMGGRIALFTATKYPTLFRKLLLESSGPGIINARERVLRRKTDALWAHKLRTMNTKNFISLWYSSPLFSSLAKNPKRLRTLMEKRKVQNRNELSKVLIRLGAGAQKPLWKKLRSLPFPIWVLAGKRDVKYVKISTDMKKYCRVIHVSQIPDTGHNIHFENYYGFTRELDSFLKTSEGPSSLK